MIRKQIVTGLMVATSCMLLFTGCGRRNDSSGSDGWGSGNGTVVKNSEYSSETESITTEATSASVEVDASGIYESLLRDELIPKYGLASNEPIKGIMNNYDVAWLNPEGIVAAYQQDLDNDGTDDLLVYAFQTKASENVGGVEYELNMMVYTISDGKAILTDSKVANIDGLDAEAYNPNVCIYQNQSSDVTISVSDVVVGEHHYLVHEIIDSQSTFADGIYMEYWATELKNGSLETAFAYKQQGAGSAGFEYWAYEFENGKSKEGVLYAAQFEESKYGEDFDAAIVAYFGEHGIKANASNRRDSILTDQNDMQAILRVRNDRTSEGVQPASFQYCAVDYTDVHKDFPELIAQANQPQSADGGSTDGKDPLSDPDGYILPDISTRKLTEQDLVGMNSNTIRLARNELYARHGRKFKDEELQNYFGSKNWYHPTIEADDFNDKVLNEIEEYNRDFIVEYEKKMN